MAAGSALREVFARFGIDMDASPLVAGDNAVNSFVGNLGGLGRALGSAAIVVGIRSFVQDMTALGDEIGDTSAMLGISGQELQEWRHVAGLSGVEAQEFTGAMSRLQNTMAQGGQGAQVFARLGVDIRDANGELRNASDVLTDLADPIAAIESTSERTGVLVDLLGRSGARLGPLFARGAEGIREARAELAELGGGVSQEAIEAAGELDDANRRLDASWLGIRGRISLFVLPVFTALAEAGTRIASRFSRMVDQGRILQVSMAAIATVAAASSARTMIAWVRAAAPFVAVGVAILALILLIEDLTVAVEGGESVFQGFADSLDAWAASAGTEGAMGVLAAGFEFVKGTIVSAIDTLLTFLQLIGLVDSNPLGDIVGQIGNEGDGTVSTRGQQIADRNRESLGALEFVLPDSFERFLAVQEASGETEAQRTGALSLLRPSDGTRGAAPVVSQSVSIARIDTTGMTAAEAEAMVTRSVRSALSAQADDTLDTLGGGV